MQISSKNITKTFSKKWEALLRGTQSLGSNPQRDWRLLLWGTAVLLAAMISFSALLFVRVNSGEFAAVAPTNPARVETLERARLADVLEELGARSMSLERLREAPPSVVDPAQ